MNRQPSKKFYLDHFGNMSTSSNTNSNSTNGTGVSTSLVRKQILPLKPKQNNNYVQHLEHKSKKMEVPVTNLELKKKENQKSDINIVTSLIYRKQMSRDTLSTTSNDRIRDHEHRHSSSKRPGSPSSSGYETDSLVDMEQQENYEFAQLVENTFNNHFNMSQPIMPSHQLDMLHSHPVWAPPTNMFGFDLS